MSEGKIISDLEKGGYFYEDQVNILSFETGFQKYYRNSCFPLNCILSACVFLFGVFYSIMMNFEYMVKKAENEVCVTVFFDEGLSVQRLRSWVIQSATVQRFQAFIIHRLKKHGITLSQNILQHIRILRKALRIIPLINSATYEVYLSDAGMQGTLVTYLENLDGVRQVNRSEATASRSVKCGKAGWICGNCSDY